MSEIDAVGFGPTVDMLSNAMAGSDMEHAAIANNIANVNTPNYHRQNVSFKDALMAAQGEMPDGNDLAMSTNDARQFETPGSTPEAFAPQMQVDTDTQMRPDGSNVDVDVEMARLSQNSGYGQTMAQLLQVQFMRLREAITEQTH